jgi:hypothetical protein
VFLRDAEATPGAADIERAIEGPSNTGPVCPPTAANVRIRAVILGSIDILTDNAAELSAAREPSIRAAHDTVKNAAKHKSERCFIIYIK